MLLVLNNKCNFGKEEFKSYISELESIKTIHKVVIAPTYLNIPAVNIKKMQLAAQNVSLQGNGQYTGEVSAEQLKSYGVEYCIIGHSERRKYQRENSEEIGAKLSQLLSKDIVPIFCIGESFPERQQNVYKETIIKQLDEVLSKFSQEDRKKVIIAYEPIWSIGTGQIPTVEQIDEVNELIKSKYNTLALYGGSANESNIDELKKCQNVDGFLLGGLSLNPQKFQEFVNKL